MNEEPIDPVVFSELKETTGEEFASELVLTFLDEARGMLTELKTAAEESDADGYRRAAHSIKSNANTFGAVKLAELARQIETGPLPEAGNLDRVSALEAEFQRSGEALRNLLDG